MVATSTPSAVSWVAARRVAGNCVVGPRSSLARLDEAAGCILAADLTVLAEDPPVDCAAIPGFAVSGPGPWAVTTAPLLHPGGAMRVAAGDPLPEGADAVIGERQARVYSDAHDRMLVSGVDPSTGIRDTTLRPMLGSGITPQGAHAERGSLIAPRGQLVTAAVVAAAAASGHDALTVVTPPTIETVIVGQRLARAGLPRPGRPRDTLSVAVPAIARAYGARTAPVRIAPTLDHLRQELADATGDVIVLAGSLTRRPDTMVRAALQERQAHWLLDGVAMTPGAGLMLARLPDDRIAIGVPAEPRAAMAGVLTVLPGVISALRGVHPTEPGHAVLQAPAPYPEFMRNARLFPVRLHRDEARGDPRAEPIDDFGPGGLGAWAVADAIAVATPGTGAPTDRVQIITLQP